MTLREAADTIRDTVSAQQVAELYGYRPNRGGYIGCPFHGEKTPSLKLHKSGWYCYGCGRGGSVIDFVMYHESCSFFDAVRALDKHLHLGLIAERAVSLTADVNADKRRGNLGRLKEQFEAFILASMEAAEGLVLRWWGIYRDACATPPQDRTAAQWWAVDNAREWCMYCDDVQNELRKQMEEVKAWRVRP